MPKFQPITASRHSTLRWKRATDYSFAASDAAVPLADLELANAATALPIALIEVPGDRYVPVAVLGYQGGQNLCVTAEGRWLPDYLPAVYRSFPFMLRPGAEGRHMLCIDEERGLAADGEHGEPFFGEDGKPTQVVSDVLEFLTRVAASSDTTRRACEAIKKHGLVQPWPITVKDGEVERQVKGLFRIDVEALNALSAEAFDELRRAGALLTVFSQIISMNNLPRLMQFARRGGGQARSTAASE